MTWVVVLGICAAGFVTLLVANRLRTHKAMQKDGARTESDFLARYEGAPISSDVLKAAFVCLREGMPADFPVDPKDDLGRVYGMYEEDLDDAVVRLAAAADRSLVAPAAVKDMAPVRTVDDLVRFVASLPSRS